MGVIHEVSVSTGFTSIVCILDCVTTSSSPFGSLNEANLAS